MDHPGPFPHPREPVWHPRRSILDHRDDPELHRDDSKCIPIQFWIIPMIQNASRYISNHRDTFQRTLEDVRSVQFLVTSRIATVQNRIGSSFSTFETRPETFSRVRGRISNVQNCIAMIQNCIGMMRRIIGVRQTVSRCIWNHRDDPECIAIAIKEVNRASS